MKSLLLQKHIGILQVQYAFFQDLSYMDSVREIVDADTNEESDTSMAQKSENFS